MSKRVIIGGRSVSEGAARVYRAVQAARHSPTNEQLCTITGYCVVSVGHKLNELEAAGLIAREYDASRAGRGVGVAERRIGLVHE